VKVALRLLLVLPAAAGAWAPLARLAVVAPDAQGDDDLYLYCAAAPAMTFRCAGETYQAPLLAADLGRDTFKYFVESWRGYLDGRGGLKQLVAIGGVASADVAWLRQYFGLGADAVWEVGGSPPAAACELSRDWTASEYVVVAPYLAAPTVRDLESAANAAAVAARLNAPLFYAAPAGLSAETLAAMAPLAPSRAVVVEIDDRLAPAVNDQLGALGVEVAADLKTEAEVVAYVNALTDPGPATLCCFRGRDQLAPAAVAAARYGGFVLEVPPAFSSFAGDVERRLDAAVPPSREKLERPYVLPADVREGEQAVADQFYAWLEGLGGTDPSRLEYVLTFALAGDAGLSYVWDRAILGDSETPAERGAAAGRFVNAPADNLCSFALTSGYRALVFDNPRPGHVTFSGVAYTALNAVTNDDYFTDNYGRPHKVNEVLGCHAGGYDDPGVWQDFDDVYDVAAVHDGREPGVGTHPLVPGEALVGFPEDVRRGTGFFYSTSHGSSGGIYPFMTDDGVAANVPWGQADWPGGPSGIVDNLGELFSYNRWHDMCGNNRGLVAAFNACSVAEGQMNEVATRHLAAAAVSAYVPVTFMGSGWFWCSFVDRLVKRGYSLGEAMCYATAQVSEIFPAHRPGVDGTIRYVLVGDPFMYYYQPTWAPPVPADLDRDYGGHNPGGSGRLARDFNAEAAPRRVTLRWQGGAERPLAGWNLYRAASPVAALDPAGGVHGPARVNDELVRGRSPYSYEDGPLAPGEYYYWLEAVEANGRTARYGPALAAPAAGVRSFLLAQNRPNPCRTHTTISFVLPAASYAELAVYDLRGALVRRLWEGPAAAGGHAVSWDGRGEDGRAVPPGVYVYRLAAGDESAIRKMVVVR